MEDIIIRYTFELSNGATKTTTIKDIREDISETEIIALANKLIAKNAEYNGFKFTSMKKCEKIITNTEIIES